MYDVHDSNYNYDVKVYDNWWLQTQWLSMIVTSIHGREWLKS